MERCGECWPAIGFKGDPEAVEWARTHEPEVTEDGANEMYEPGESQLAIASVGLFAEPLPARVEGPGSWRTPIYEKWTMPDGRIIGRRHNHYDSTPARVVILPTWRTGAR